jgi:hypothetical protein
MRRGIDCRPDSGNIAFYARGGLIVHHGDRLDGVPCIGAEPLEHLLRPHAGAPVTGHQIHVESQALRHLRPQHGEVTGLEREHLVTRRKRVDQGGLPGAGARGRVKRHRPRGAGQTRHPAEHLAGQLGELRAAVVDRGRRHRAQHPVRNIRWPGDLQKMPAASVIHCPIM